MNKKHILLFMLCLLTAILLPLNAMAAGEVNTAEKGSFSISFIADGENADGVEFKIYHFADISSSNNYSVTEAFKSYPISYNNIDDPDTWRNLSQTLCGYVASDNLPPYATAVTTESGRAYFSDLPVGLYLVIGSKYTSDTMTYKSHSFMISVPSKDVNGNLQYDLMADVKYDIVINSGSENNPNYGGNSDDYELDILKIWDDNNNPNRPQEIIVEIYRDYKLYDTVALNKANNWKYKLENLSERYIWTVRERSVENGYTVSVEQQNNRFVITNTNTDITTITTTKPDETTTVSTTTDITNTTNNTSTDSTTIPGDTGTDNTEPDSAETDSSANSSHSVDNTLPKTGLLWWPVPCMLAGGLLAIIIGVLFRRGAENEG